MAHKNRSIKWISSAAGVLLCHLKRYHDSYDYSMKLPRKENISGLDKAKDRI